MTQESDLRGSDFPSTCWSRLAAGDEAAAGRALEVLAQAYWRPIAAFVRARWARTDDEARDATQEFFVWMLESGFLRRADPARGRFRGFVKTCLRNFLQDRERARRAWKRGGQHAVLSLDGAGENDPTPEPADPRAGEPDEALDAAWRRELLARASEALEAELAGRGKPVVFAVFRDFYLADLDLDYAALAARHGITTVDVSNHLMLAKRRYRALLRSAVLETVGSDEELRAELAWLFAEGRRP